jgi:ABC-type transport system involved in multi-copper enzyme maturation permease subunit
MFRLLNIEFHKLKHSRASKVLIITYFALLTSTALIASIKFNFAEINFHLAELGIFNFPYIWHLNTWLSSIIKFFLLLVIVSMMANEYSNKTLKQNLIDGLSKREFILSKFYTVIVFAGISTLFVFLVSLILGLLYSDFTETAIIFSDLEYLFAFFIKLVGFFSFGLFMGILIKRSAFAVGAIFVWFIIESISKGILYWKLDENPMESPLTTSILQFFPLEAMSNLIKEPFTRFSAVKSLASQVGEDLSKDYSVHLTDIMIVSVWTAIFIYLSYRLLKRRDL